MSLICLTSTSVSSVCLFESFEFNYDLDVLRVSSGCLDTHGYVIELVVRSGLNWTGVFGVVNLYLFRWGFNVNDATVYHFSRA